MHSAPLAGVTVVVRNVATGAEAQTTTAKNGSYRFAALDVGSNALRLRVIEADAPNAGVPQSQDLSFLSTNTSGTCTDNSTQTLPLAALSGFTSLTLPAPPTASPPLHPVYQP